MYTPQLWQKASDRQQKTRRNFYVDASGVPHLTSNPFKMLLLAASALLALFPLIERVQFHSLYIWSLYLALLARFTATFPAHCIAMMREAQDGNWTRFIAWFAIVVIVPLVFKVLTRRMTRAYNAAHLQAIGVSDPYPYGFCELLCILVTAFPLLLFVLYL